MNKFRGSLLLGLLLALGCSSSEKDGKKVDRTTDTVIDLGGLTNKPLAAWKEETPSGSLRDFQFRLPRVEGDSADAELVVFKPFGGTAEQNVDRWKKQFLAPAGKKIDDLAKVDEFKVAGYPVTYLDITGTYLDGSPRMTEDQKVKRENYRMLAVQFDAPRKSIHIKLTGPAATVAEYKSGFDEWLKSFK
jgi:hypothetical protein